MPFFMFFIISCLPVELLFYLAPKLLNLPRKSGQGLGRVVEHHAMNEEEKPKRTKRQFDEAFRRQAVALVETSGKPLREIAAELGVSHWNLRDWKAIYGQRSTPAQLEEQLQRLRAENATLRDQRDALKKALGILAEPSRSASPK